MPGVGRLNDKSIKELFFDLIVIIMSNISRFSQLRFCHIFQRLTKKLWNYLHPIHETFKTRHLVMVGMALAMVRYYGLESCYPRLQTFLCQHMNIFYHKSQS